MKHTAQPLADLLRPTTLEDVVGQEHLLGAKGALTHLVQRGHLPSLILWGPPGTGKTTIARLLANTLGRAFFEISAALSGIAALREAIEEAEAHRSRGQLSVIFVDECHRWNKSQQDAFLPIVETGSITWIGATTEPPVYEINAALLSRCRVLKLKPLGTESLELLLLRAEKRARRTLPLTSSARDLLKHLAAGDGRRILNWVEDLFVQSSSDQLLDLSALEGFLKTLSSQFSNATATHSDLISAMQKAIRASDADAGLYWLARLIELGAPLPVVARRIVATALEDVGLADPQALAFALSARDAVEYLGPSGELALAQAVIYLSVAPKSSASADAFEAARIIAAKTSTSLTRFGPNGSAGESYLNDHRSREAFAGQSHFPDDVGRQSFYHPKERGFEREILKRLAYWARLRSDINR